MNPIKDNIDLLKAELLSGGRFAGQRRSHGVRLGHDE